MSEQSVAEKKQLVREVAKKTADIERFQFIRETVINTGLTEQEINDQFTIDELRMVRDLDENGDIYFSQNKFTLKRK